MYRPRLIATVVLLSFLGLVDRVDADLATYTETFYATGSIYTESSGLQFNSHFANALITVTATADRSNIQFDGSTYSVSAETASVSISGLGSYTISTGSPNDVFIADSTSQEAVYIGCNFEGALTSIGTMNSVFGSYTLDSPIGPITSGVTTESGDLFSADLSDADTSRTLTISSLTSTNSTFQAVAAPEPTSQSMLMIGLGAVCMAVLCLDIRRRRGKTFRYVSSKA